MSHATCAGRHNAGKCDRNGQPQARVENTRLSRPTLTLARSPRMMHLDSTIVLPCSTMFWLPQSTVSRLILLPDWVSMKLERE